MLHFPGLSAYAWRYSNAPANPADNANTGYTNTAGIGAYGSWSQVISAANMANDASWIRLIPLSAFGNNSNRAVLVEIGVDPAGGTSYTSLGAEMLTGGRGSTSGYNGDGFLLPVRIRAGSSVAVRSYSSPGYTWSPRVTVYGVPSRPELVPVGSIFRQIGTTTPPAGQSITPGSSGSYSSWVDLGATADRLWWWQLGVASTATTLGTLQYYFELAFGDATNKHLLQRQYLVADTNERQCDISAANINLMNFRPVPAGANIYVRATCSGTPSSGWTVLANGVG